MHNSWFVSEWRWGLPRTGYMASTLPAIKLSIYKFVRVIKFVSFQSGCLEDVLTDTWPSSYRSQRPAFPGTLLVWLREPLWEVSSSHCCSVSPFLQATVSGIIYLWQWTCLECVCVCVCGCVCGPVCICVSARVPASAGRVSARVTWVSQGRSSERGDGGTSREDECFQNRGGYHYSYLCCAWLIFWITVAGC